MIYLQTEFLLLVSDGTVQREREREGIEEGMRRVLGD